MLEMFSLRPEILMVENEVDMWHEILDIFCPISGTILEVDDCEGNCQ